MMKFVKTLINPVLRQGIFFTDAFTSAPGWIKPFYLPGEVCRVTPGLISVNAAVDKSNEKPLGKEVDIGD